MGNNFDFNSKKYMFLLIIICIVFAIFIVKAFDYLPDNDVVDTNDNEIANINNTYRDNLIDNSNIDNKKPKPVQKRGVLYRSKDSLSSNEMEFDEIDAPNGVAEESFSNENIYENSEKQLSPDEYALKALMKAKMNAKSNNLSASFEEYKKVIDMANAPDIKAEAYEGIALLYAKKQKYETALSFANKAYNLSPSPSNELLIAQIYYYSGKSDVAIAKINNMLKRGFNY